MCEVAKWNNKHFNSIRIGTGWIVWIQLAGNSIVTGEKPISLLFSRGGDDIFRDLYPREKKIIDSENINNGYNLA